MINKNSGDFFEEDIDFKALIKIFSRNKKKVIAITFLTSLFSIISCFFTKPYWKGEFDIVLSEEQNPIASRIKANSGIYNLLGQETIEQSLKTQVEILKSASVLMPVFENYKELMNSQNNNQDPYRFSSWSEKLKVTLKPNTAVLNIQYRDNNKDNVLVILSEISEIYKGYVKGERFIGIKKGESYINEQIQIYEKLYFDSMIKEKNFASKNNLLYKRDTDEITKSESVIYLSEQIINKNLNEIREIERNIELLKNSTSEDIYVLGKLLNKDFKTGESNLEPLIKDLGNIKIKLTEANLYFNKNDLMVKNLEDQLISKSKALRKTLINTLINKKNILNNEVEASFKEPSIFNQHLQLIADLDQKKTILSSLINESIQLSLFNEVDQDPWKLITKPTLFPNSIKPSKSTFGLSGLFFGFILGMIISRIQEFRSKLLFTPRQVKKVLDKQFNNVYELNCNYEIEKDLKIMLKKIYKDNQKIFIACGDSSIQKRLFKKNIIQLKEKKIDIINNLENIDESIKDNIILIIKTSKIQFDELEKFSRKLELLNLNIDNLIILD